MLSLRSTMDWNRTSSLLLRAASYYVDDVLDEAEEIYALDAVLATVDLGEIDGWVNVISYYARLQYNF